QLPALVDDYLAWKHSHLRENQNNPAPHSIFHVTAVGISGNLPSLFGYNRPNEPILIPRHLHCMDGNFSAKRLDGSGTSDPRIFHSCYFIPQADVEHFKDDVHNNHSAPQTTVSCTENWIAAKAVEENKIVVFDQMGIFLVACHHGFIECVTEMACSGKLAKYGLAAVNKVLDVCGNDQAIGHDIACSSRKTIAASSIGCKAEEVRLQLVVNAFHGFSHNRHCQLENHPLYLAGLGIEDLETCERIFASSNSTASLIRHTSHFHWVQFLDLHFEKWDTDKYLELTLQIIEHYSVELEEFKQCKDLVGADFLKWQDEESEYLGRVATEPTADTIAVAYVENLEKLKHAEAMYSSVTSVPFLTYTPTNFMHTLGLNAATCHHSKAFEADYAAAL
ncbi:hypothetical protein EDB19DRAFT_1643359, partial [Suillus lakei]